MRYRHSRNSTESIFGRIAVFAASVAVCLAVTTLARADERPNIIIILVDDMGFSDVGCYGGEIDTPNIDSLAAGGLRFTQFYNSGRCCPTRASLMLRFTLAVLVETAAYCTAAVRAE